jgi:hypothetical protein
MPDVIGHLVGHGRRRPWHIFTLLWLVPVGITLRWLRRMEPGAGPQGGEAIVLFLLLAVMGIAFCTVVNAFRLYRGRPRTGPVGWLRRVIVVFGSVLAALILFWEMLDKATSMVTADGDDPIGWAGVFGVLTAMFAFNAWALVHCCTRADSQHP